MGSVEPSPSSPTAYRTPSPSAPCASPLPGRAVGGPRNLRRDIVAGFDWMWRHRVIRFMAFMNGIGNLVLASGNSLVLVVPARQQHAAPTGIGLMVSVYVRPTSSLTSVTRG